MAEGTHMETGSFQEMVTLASQRALYDGGLVVIHRQGCEYPVECMCQPKAIEPYEPVNEPKEH